MSELNINSLLGFWTISESLNNSAITNEVIFNINFEVSHLSEYTSITLSAADVKFGTESIINPETNTVKEEYRHLRINDGNDILDETLINWFKTNATKISELPQKVISKKLTYLDKPICVEYAIKDIQGREIANYLSQIDEGLNTENLTDHCVTSTKLETSIYNRLMNSLQVPVIAGNGVEIVGIDTNKAQQNFKLSSSFIIKDGVITLADTDKHLYSHRISLTSSTDSSFSSTLYFTFYSNSNIQISNTQTILGILGTTEEVKLNISGYLLMSGKYYPIVQLETKLSNQSVKVCYLTDTSMGSLPINDFDCLDEITTIF